MSILCTQYAPQYFQYTGLKGFTDQEAIASCEQALEDYGSGTAEAIDQLLRESSNDSRKHIAFGALYSLDGSRTGRPFTKAAPAICRDYAPQYVQQQTSGLPIRAADIIEHCAKEYLSTHSTTDREAITSVMGTSRIDDELLAVAVLQTLNFGHPSKFIQLQEYARKIGQLRNTLQPAPDEKPRRYTITGGVTVRYGHQ